MTTDPGTDQPEATPTLVQRLAAEAMGTFVLVFVGAGSLALYIAAVGVSGAGGALDLTTWALAFALGLTGAGYAFARISGGHFNPAVSVASAVSGRMSWRDAGGYAGAQVGGALVAGLLLLVLVLGFDRADAGDSLAQSGFGDSFSGFAWWAAVLLEILLTAVFVLVVLAVTDARHEHRGVAPLAIGLTYGAVVLAGGAATGGSANPARSIGTNLFAGVDPLLALWVFVLGPLLGAVIAGVTYPLIFGRDAAPVPGSGITAGTGRSRQAQDPYAGWDQGYHPDQQYGGERYGGQQYGAAPGQWGQQQGGWEQGGWQQGGWQGQQQGWQEQPQQPQQPQQYPQDPYSQQPHPQDQPPPDPGSPGDGGHTRMRPGDEPR